MSIWYGRVTADENNYMPLVDAIAHFEREFEEAKLEVRLKGSVETASARLPGIMAHRFGQLQEIEAIHQYLLIRLTKAKGLAFKKFLEGYHRTMSSRDAEKYADADDKVIELSLLINQTALIRNQYLAIMKGLDTKSYQINNITRLKVAGMEDYDVD
jgi:hypothetical protein